MKDNGAEATRTGSSSHHWLRWLPWALAVAALIWVLRIAPLTDILAVLRQLTWPQLLALILINAVIVLALGGRWWIVLQAQGYRLPYLRLTAYRLAVYSVSYFTPGPHFGGEPVQIYLPRQHHAVPGSTATAAVLLDKAVELLANFAVLAIGVAAILRLGLVRGRGEWLLAIVAVTLLLLPMIYLGAARLGIKPLSWLLNALPIMRTSTRLATMSGVIQRSESQVSEFCRRRPVALVLALIVSLLTWALMIGEYGLAARFLGITLTPMQALAALAAARLAYLLPFPGGLGALEASQVFVIGALGFDPAAGAALALLIRARDVALALLGLWLGARFARPRSPVRA